MKKTFVLVALFILPIVAYLFFASGINNFGKLPILKEGVPDLIALDASVTLDNKITILGFLGKETELNKGNAFNLNQKIYKRFHEFHDFQLIMVVPKGTEEKVGQLKKELGALVSMEKWIFVFAEDQDIKKYFNALGTNLSLDKTVGSPYVFIIDKDRNLRGRKADEDEGVKYGFNTISVAELNNKMEDDVKIILAEYRLALKKNNAERKK
ncbi:hypothetical protein [Spongiimicrobium salis]|uniref:hypothetical protein n=1 Tax=Spongiimicrobium salis TaxID=1667022 RepID=UPI00374D2CE8